MKRRQSETRHIHIMTTPTISQSHNLRSTCCTTMRRESGTGEEKQKEVRIRIRMHRGMYTHANRVLYPHLRPVFLPGAVILHVERGSHLTLFGRAFTASLSRQKRDNRDKRIPTARVLSSLGIALALRDRLTFVLAAFSSSLGRQIRAQGHALLALVTVSQYRSVKR